MSFLTRLLLLVSLALAPICALEVWNQIDLRRQRSEEIHDHARQLLSLLGGEQKRLVEGVRQMLELLAETPAAQDLDAPACQSLLSRTGARIPDYLTITLTGADGIILCATNPALIGRPIADRMHVRAALEGGGFTVGEFIRLRHDGNPAMPFGLPIRRNSADGPPIGVVTALIDLGWLERYLSEHPLPDNASLLVADGNGTVLAQAPASPGIVGTVLPQRFRPLLEADAVGTAQLMGIDGVERVFAYVPLSAGVRHIFVAIGIDHDAAMGSIDDALRRSLILIAATLLLGLLAAYVIARRHIYRPVAALLAATERWRAADHSVRVGAIDGPEMSRLGLSFDALVEDLDRQMRAKEEASAALRASEERLRALVENAPHMMWVNHPDGTLEFVNAAFRAYTGRLTTEGNRMEDLHPDDVGNVQAIRARAIAAGAPHEYELRLRRADGAYRWHLSRTHPIHQGGRIVAWYGGAVDIHDIHHARDAAEEAGRSKSRFLAAASHDLRQPMQSILLFAEVLRPHLGDGPGLDALGRLQDGLEILKGLLDGLLDISRLDAGIVAPQLEEFRASDLLRSVDDAFAPLAREKGLDWQVKPCHTAIRSDRVLLGRMLRNLVENAIRYTDRGGVTVECTLQGDHLLIGVRDSGCGIPADQIDRVFEELYQIDNPERDRNQGLGLGLAIVRRLSDLLDHPVTVHSQSGQGALFSIAVPLATDDRIPESEPTAEEPTPPERGETRLAVVVDDDPIVLAGMESILRAWKFDVIAAGSTDHAVEALERDGRRPDILIVDYRLRDKRIGTEAILRIRAMHDPGIPGLIVTGEIGTEPQNDALRYGFHLLHKPVTPRTLAAALCRHLADAEGDGRSPVADGAGRPSANR
ncbi:ATP-binding protein [Azospirillum sp. B2RO_4]|uniref:ATP-binding protein n=1 Tax=Azospirillum sp. B2RO_4 TaxID=3027796 RepID=UPI003DA9CBEB